MNRDIFGSVFAIFTSRFGAQVVTIAVTPILVRMLGSAGYGDYSFLLSMLSAMMVFVYGGSFNGIRKFIAEDRDQSNWSSDVFGFYFQIVALFSAVVILLIVLGINTGVIDRWLNENFHVYFYLLVLIIPVRALFRVSRSTLMGLGLERYSEPLVVIEKILFGVLAISFVYMGNGVAGALAGKAFALALTALFAFVLVTRYIPARSVLGWSTGIPHRKILRYTLLTMLLKLLTVSLYHTDIIFIRLFIGSTQTGYYRAALTVAEFLWFVPAAIQLALLHSTSNLWVNNRYEEITSISTRAVRYTLLLSVLLGLGIASLSNQFISLYFGPDFTTATTPLILLLPGAIGFAVAQPIFAISQGQNQLRSIILATGAASGINIILNLFLIPLFGISGAAIATSVGYGSMWLLHVWSARQIGFDPIVDLRLSRIVVTAVISAAPILLLPHVISSDSVSLLVVPPVGFLIYWSIAVKSQAIDVKEIATILDRMPIPTENLTRLLSKGES